MAETKATKKETKAFVPTRNAETAVGSFTHGEVVYLHDSPEVKALVEAGYLQTQEDYLDQNDTAVLNQMERDQGVSARERESESAQ